MLLTSPQEQMRLQSLFAPGASGVKLLGGLFQADVLALSVCKAAGMFMDKVGAAWASHISGLTDAVSGWTPAIPDKETLLKDASTVKALIGNPGYPKLPLACDLLEGMRRLTQSFQKDGTQITPPVPLSVAKAAKQAVVAGIECVSITFAVYLIEHQLPSEKTLVNRTKTVDDFLKSCDKQGVVLGASLTKALEDFKVAKTPVAPKAAGGKVATK